jgi:hypothetical protein
VTPDSRFTASENADVAASYSVASRVFSSQAIAPCPSGTEGSQYRSRYLKELGYYVWQHTADNHLVVKQASVGCIPRVQRLLLKLKLLSSPRLSSYRFVVNWELILSPDPKGRFILLL